MILLKALRFLEKHIFSVRMGALYILLFAAAIGIATFIENDFGTSAAQKVIFKSKWFEALLLFFGISILLNIFKFRFISQKKWAPLIFHLAIIIILLGSAVTRYFGYEGMMHIREGKASNEFLSADTYINFKVSLDNKSYTFSEPVLFASLGKNYFNESYQIGSHLISAELLECVPNPTEEMEFDPEGVPMMKIVIGGMRGREEYHVKLGSQLTASGVRLNFSEVSMPGYINILIRGDSIKFVTDQPVTQMVMATKKIDTIFPGIEHVLLTRALYTVGKANFVVADFARKAKLVSSSKDIKIKNESIVGLKVKIGIDQTYSEQWVTGRKGEQGEMEIIEKDDVKLGISYGSTIVQLPFSIYLRDFILDRYPGTDNPSSYASEVTLQDQQHNVNREQRIFMNNILDYRGFRFFQSSFDPDEKGTYLSVNHDFWGTWLSYIGYFLLTLGLVLIFIQPKTRFAHLMKTLNKLQQKSLLIIGCITFSMMSIYNDVNAQTPVNYLNDKHASQLGKILVQDFQGRFKPFNTLASEILRKIAKRENIEDISAEAVFMSMILSPETWEQVPLIQVGSHPEVQKMLNSKEKLVPYRRFFNDDGTYKLKESVRKAQGMNPKDHGVFEKAIIKLDEKVNIANMVFSARIFRIYPLPNDENNTWISPAEINESLPTFSGLDFIKGYFPNYLQALKQAKETQNWAIPDKMLEELQAFQKDKAGLILPSTGRQSAELFLNKAEIFSRLRNVYGILGLVLLFGFLYTVVRHSVNRFTITKIAFITLAVAFVVHTIGLALRWYVSGHAPWSNGYESMIYIAWTTMLGGLIFSRKSLGGLAATCILAATILLVAGMSWLDPEITPLVPVLKSYWLTIHVSLEAGSYGFLLLGAVIGMLNLLLMILTRPGNIENIKRAIMELTIVSEITVTAGLVMVSVGTYLGGVWANESWGRYWGWDAKETWALVTILVYAFILHMRFIPKLKSIYTYNCATLFGFATVIMTYYGVNYYLSGLHSYAAGDPVPIPPVVYYTAILLTVLSIVAYINYRRRFPNGFYLH